MLEERGKAVLLIASHACAACSLFLAALDQMLGSAFDAITATDLQDEGSYQLGCALLIYDGDYDVGNARLGEMYRLVRKQHPQLPIIVSYASRTNIDAALELAQQSWENFAFVFLDSSTAHKSFKQLMREIQQCCM